MQRLTGDETSVLANQHRHTARNIISRGKPAQRRLRDDALADVFGGGAARIRAHGQTGCDGVHRDAPRSGLLRQRARESDECSFGCDVVVVGDDRAVYEVAGDVDDASPLNFFGK